MLDERSGPVRYAALMVGARVANLAIGLVAIPVLIRYLGGPGFAAWAILLAVSGAFSILEIGMGPSIVRFLALPAVAGVPDEGRRLFGRMWLLLATSFTGGLVLVLAFAGPFARWVGLPGTERLAAEQAIYLVFAAVAVRAVLQSGSLAMIAGHRFVAASSISLLQSLCSNVAAMSAAWLSGRLDLTLVAYWSGQLAVLAVVFVIARGACWPRFDRATFEFKRLRELGYYGVTTQMEGWAQFVNFQFDKFIVAGFVGLWGVAPYEVANRAVAALRSIPASAADSLLPGAVARHADREAAWQWYLSSTSLASYGVIAFILAPLAVSPVFLYAWTGEMGYVGRWVFTALAIGAMASVLALPAATLMQAMSRPGVPGRAALLSVLANIVLSLVLVLRWEMIGAAIGTAVAMVASAAQLGYAAHRQLDRPIAPTARMLARFWAPTLVCVCWGVFMYALFDAWFDTLDPAVRFSRQTRAYPALAAAAGYAMVLASVMGVEALRGKSSPMPAALAAWRR